jgi:hypothetical protein|tara:strand:- start:6227 stop:7390 length:1164 start_codon:yes stop_codon:yes gene_type:complete
MNITNASVIIVAILYCIVLYLLVTNDIIGVIGYTKNYEGFYIFLAILGFYLLGMSFIYTYNPSGNQSITKTELMYFLLKCFGVVAFFGIILLAIFIILWTLGNIPDIVGGIAIVINIIIIVGLIAAVIKFTKSDVLYSNDYTWKGLIKNIIFYLPCVFIDIVEWFKYQYKITTRTDVIILFIDFILILFGVYWKKIYNWLFKPRSHMLLNEPIYINKETILGSYEDLNTDINKDGDFLYNYAINSWIYINYQTPNVNPSYSQWTTLLNYGNKPSIEYNGLKNKLRVTMSDGQDGTKVIYENNSIKMNKWNHFLINYVGGTLDIFINGELVKSEPGVVPYMKYDRVITGASPGIHGGICNVEYFNRSLSLSTIKSLYSSLKNKNPPII